MTQVRKVDIQNFRAIRSLTWCPSPGFNCLIGAGDSGKSTIVDAIDLCLGARRNVSLGDTDFHKLDVAHPVRIEVTIGSLPDALKDLDTYGHYLRGLDQATGLIEDEPRQGLETVLTLRLAVNSDLEPQWSLVSQRAAAMGLERNLAWKDRQLIAPARLGTYASANLTWTRGSVLNRLSEERPSLGEELARAARDARASFGAQASPQLADALQIVARTAADLGVDVGGNTQALLDSHSVSISDGAIALHGADGVPLRVLGTGSSRLLVAGLQRASAHQAPAVLVDEIEFGLEPHRLTRLLGALGSKANPPPLQVFMTTHSPVVVRELSGQQIALVRPDAAGGHHVKRVGNGDEVQATLRRDPEAFLAKSIIVCEGASEVGLVRGLDDYWTSLNGKSMLAAGTAYVDVGGGDPDRCYIRGRVLADLGYRVLVFVDADKLPTANQVEAYLATGATHLAWRPGRALEDELFLSLPDVAVDALLRRAVDLVGEDLVDEHIRTQTGGQVTLGDIRGQRQLQVAYPLHIRQSLGLVSRNRRNSWFKSVTKFEGIGYDIVGPHLQQSEAGFVELVNSLYWWAHAP